MGAWIETKEEMKVGENYKVAPRVGAWIETGKNFSGFNSYVSLPAWERGLKRYQRKTERHSLCRSPRGSVD